MRRIGRATLLSLSLLADGCRPRAPEIATPDLTVGAERADGGDRQRLAGAPCVALRQGDHPAAFAKVLSSEDGRILYVQGLPILSDFESPGLERVEVLVLHDVLLPELGWLERLPRLRELVLDHVRGGEPYRKPLVWESYDAGRAAVDLLALDVSRADRSNVADDEAAPGWTSLLEEVVRQDALSTTDLRLDDILAGLPVLPSLETLRIRVSATVSVPIHIERWYLSSSSYSHQPPPSLLSAARQPNLRELYLDASGGWLSLAAEPALQLERLELRNAYVISLEPLASQRALQDLGLTNMVGLGTDPGGEDWSRAQPAMDLSALAELPELRELRVVNSSVKDLAFLEAMTGLETLDLQWSWVEDLSALAGGARPCRVDLVGMPPHPYRDSERCDSACCRAGEIEHQVVGAAPSCKAACGGSCVVEHHCTWESPPEVVLPGKRLWSDERSAGLTGLNFVEVPCEP